MNKEQMKNVLTKVQELEKILMRDLTDEEIAYLESHSSKDFLFDILGYWENSDGDVGNNYYYAVWFNDDGTGYLSLDEDYNIVSFCCVDGYIIAYLDDDSSVEIPYRYNKDKSSLYLTLSNGEMRFDKGELGIG